MKKSKDIRINNIVNRTNRFGEKEMLVIKGISFRGNVYDEDDSIFGLDELEPIPLTEKIFKNTKFKTLNGRTFQIEYNTTFYVIDIKIGEFSLYFDYSGTIPLTHRKIKYVHELQNLYFALTGEELEFLFSEA